MNYFQWLIMPNSIIHLARKAALDKGDVDNNEYEFIVECQNQTEFMSLI